MNHDLPTLAQLLAQGVLPDGTIAPGFPLVLLVSPSSFVFDTPGTLLAPTSPRQHHDHACVALAASLLRTTSHVVAFPTETVYGLAADATNPPAVQNIFKAKGRPSDNPLIVHVSNNEMIKDYLLKENEDIPHQYKQVLHKHWPGPLTILLNKGDKVPDLVTAGHSSVAMPSHPVARALISLSTVPLAAPSANTSSRPSPTLASHVAKDLNQRILLILDAGPCEGGLESTVLDALRSPPCILRPGGVTLEMLHRIEGFEHAIVFRKTAANELSNDVVAPVTPGMKYKHYSPNIPVVLFEKRTTALDASRSVDTATARESALQHAMHSRILTISSDAAAALSDTSNDAPAPLTIGILRTQTVSDIPFPDLNPHLTPETTTPSNNTHLPPRIHIYQQSLGTTSAEVGANLFKALRELEALDGCCMVFVEGVEEADEGLAVMNRVRKAAGETVYY
ncbi:hypothetical protein HDU98_005714 [Podochytrium sp. JEL0797]|nr:hypothetical protein HDU98_005714 [Podochytrium sp. JEL0797]